jgi:hypothetical protein
VIFGSQTLSHCEETILIAKMKLDPNKSMDDMDDAQLGKCVCVCVCWGGCDCGSVFGDPYRERSSV